MNAVVDSGAATHAPRKFAIVTAMKVPPTSSAAIGIAVSLGHASSRPTPIASSAQAPANNRWLSTARSDPGRKRRGDTEHQPSQS